MNQFEPSTGRSPACDRNPASDIVVPEKKDIGSFSTAELVDELIGRDGVAFSIASDTRASVDQASCGPCTVLAVKNVIGTPRTLA